MLAPSRGDVRACARGERDLCATQTPCATQGRADEEEGAPSAGVYTFLLLGTERGPPPQTSALSPTTPSSLSLNTCVCTRSLRPTTSSPTSQPWVYARCMRGVSIDSCVPRAVPPPPRYLLLDPASLSDARSERDALSAQRRGARCQSTPFPLFSTPLPIALHATCGHPLPLVPGQEERAQVLPWWAGPAVCAFPLGSVLLLPPYATPRPLPICIARWPMAFQRMCRLSHCLPDAVAAACSACGACVLWHAGSIHGCCSGRLRAGRGRPDWAQREGSAN